MDVYLALLHYQYECTRILGVFSTPELATDALIDDYRDDYDANEEPEWIEDGWRAGSQEWYVERRTLDGG